MIGACAACCGSGIEQELTRYPRKWICRACGGTGRYVFVEQQPPRIALEPAFDPAVLYPAEIPPHVFDRPSLIPRSDR